MSDLGRADANTGSRAGAPNDGGAGRVLNEYATAILSHFAQGYPGSAQYRGGRKLRKGNWERIFPEIAGDVEAKEEFLRGVEALVSVGVVQVKWKRFRDGDAVEALYLEDPNLLYALSGARSPNELREHMLSICGGWKPQTEWGPAVKEHIRSKLAQFRDFPVGTPETLRDLFVLFDVTPSRARSTPVRSLSVRLFNDSKRLEVLLKSADRLTKEACGFSFSEHMGLERRYPEVLLRMDAVISFTDGIEWPLRRRAVSLPQSTMENANRITLPAGSKILSIENKESFYTVPNSRPENEFAGFFYCGGHPNNAVRALLHLLAECGVELYHFGDLDPEGVAIFGEIAEAWGADLHPFCMDESMYARYKAFGYPLNESALARCRTLKVPVLDGLLSAIESAGVGVEQEVIDPGIG